MNQGPVRNPHQVHVLSDGVRWRRLAHLSRPTKSFRGASKASAFLKPSVPAWSADANMGHQSAGGNSSWCPELESRTTHPTGI